MDLLFSILLALPVLYLVYLLLLFLKAKVPFVTTAPHYVADIFAHVAIPNGARVYDLGSGKGDFLFAAEKIHAGEFVGIELSPLHVWYAKVKARLLRSQVTFLCRDFFHADISRADVVYLFLVGTVVHSIWKKIKKECKPGTIVIVLGDAIDGEVPTQEFFPASISRQSGKVRVYKT